MWLELRSPPKLVGRQYLLPSEGPDGGMYRWGIAIIIGVEEYYRQPQGWLARSKKRLKAAAAAEGFRPYSDPEVTLMMKRVLTAIRGWDP